MEKTLIATERLFLPSLETDQHDRGNRVPASAGVGGMNQPTHDDSLICKQSFTTCVTLLLGLSIPLVFFPVQSALKLDGLYQWISINCGVFYLSAGVACFVFLVWLGMSPYGNIKLGDESEAIEFKEVSWAGMLFCAGIGGGLMRWAPVEWGYYFLSPPHGVASQSLSAADWAGAYPLFHWGPIAWAIYCLPAIAIAYPYHVKKVPWLRFSTSLHGILGDKGLQGPFAKITDILFVLSLLGGAGYSLGISTPLISGAFCHLTGIANGFHLQVITALTCVTLFSISAYLGLKKGIRLLSDWNVYLSLSLLLFILTVGPTLYILKASLSSLGFMTQNFVVMSTWMDPFTESRFVESWTVFYWAWWIAYAPFVGLFVARISRGRTIRQVIFGMLVYGSAGCMLFFMIMGNYAMHLDTVENADILTTLNSKDGGYVLAITKILDSLPLSKLATGAFCLICVIFCATTYDSASYILASAVTPKQQPGQEPAKWNRVFWAFALAALPIALLWIDAHQKTRNAETAMQSILLLTSLPILFIGALSAWSLTTQLRKDSLARLSQHCDDDSDKPKYQSPDKCNSHNTHDE
ncbi:MAG: choline transporter [Rhodopirellula sp.]|nr:choline transporter [Rhodopirellula sp.]